MDGQSFPGLHERFWPGDFFLGEAFKKIMDCLYKGHVLFFWRQCIVDPFIFIELDLPVLGVDNVVPFHDVISDAEPHFFKFWDAKYVRNPFLVEPTPNRTETSLLVSGSGPCVEISKHPSVSFPRVSKNLLIVHIIVHGAVVQVDPGRV